MTWKWILFVRLNQVCNTRLLIIYIGHIIIIKKTGEIRALTTALRNFPFTICTQCPLLIMFTSLYIALLPRSTLSSNVPSSTLSSQSSFSLPFLVAGKRALCQMGEILHKHSIAEYCNSVCVDVCGRVCVGCWACVCVWVTKSCFSSTTSSYKPDLLRKINGTSYERNNFINV